MTMLESPTTNSAPTGRPSHPSTPMLTASSISASMTPAEPPSACRKPNEPSSSSCPTVTTRIESGIAAGLRARRPTPRLPSLERPRRAAPSIALLVEAARDAADERDLQLLGAPQIIVGQRQDRDAGRLDHLALADPDHR